MDMKEAVRRRLESNIVNSGWHVIEGSPDPSAVRFWLYSINLVRGPRLGTQATAELFRDLQRQTGVFEQIKNSPYEPDLILGSTIDGFDGASNANERRHLYEPLCVALAAYARSTQTWQQMPSLTTVPGIHFLITDWLDPDDNRVIRPMLLLSEKIPCVEDFIAGMAAQLVMHLKRFPNEFPKEWSDLEGDL